MKDKMIKTVFAAIALMAHVVMAGDGCIDLDPEKYWNRDELYRVPSWRANPFPESDYPGMKAMLVKGHGLPNESGEFFAYYAVPSGKAPAAGWPAVLLVHGGGGTAFPNYVDNWRKEGFAVMALDWYNQRPAPGLTNVPPSEVTVPRVALPGGRREGYKHHVVTVANIVTAHSLLLSMPEVDPTRTCAAGLSWGSWYASVAGAVDDRFRGIISIYIADRRPTAKADPEAMTFVMGPFHKSFKNPIWWIVWPPDGNYICSSMQAGWEVCPKDAGRTIVHNLGHDHNGFLVDAVKRMAKYFTDSAPRLPLLSLGTCKDGVASAEILDPGKGIDHALLWYYDGLPGYGWKGNKDLVGHSVPAEIVGKTVRARVPAEARLCYLSVYEKEQPDSCRNVMCGSSGYFEVMPRRISVASPDGRNVIRLDCGGLSYEVLRDGVALSGKSAIDIVVDGVSVRTGATLKNVVRSSEAGRLATPVYKKEGVDLADKRAYADFGDWGIRLVARNDGVAYRFELKRPGRVKITDEKAPLVIPDANATCWVNFTEGYGREETTNKTICASAIRTAGGKESMAYLPLTYSVGGKYASVTESDVCDYPIWNLTRQKSDGSVCLDAKFARWPKETYHAAENAEWKVEPVPTGGRWVRVRSFADYLVETEGTRTLPWRTFVLADAPMKLIESDIVTALARPAAKGADFSWVRPGKVAWDWWNDWNLEGPHIGFKAGCNTRTYEYYIDFAAKHGIEYVIFDEGWSKKLDVWEFHPDVDVPHLIQYAERKNVGIILWMAWAQVAGDEAHVAEHFAKLGAKGFKIDFMDRGDAQCERFLWTFAEECRKNRMLVDYHGAHRPTGMSRAYPNVLNYEGIHGLEQMKWYRNTYDFLDNDIKEMFCRFVAGPADYTPGAMDNYRVGAYAGTNHNPGSIGTRARQMAMMAAYEAPLQMLCDAPTKYERNLECFSFMAKVPVVWKDTRGLAGDPHSYAAVARQAKDGAWYVAVLGNAKPHAFSLGTEFLGEGEWQAEIFEDAPDSDVTPTKYVHRQTVVKGGAALPVRLASGGGFVARLTKIR